MTTIDSRAAYLALFSSLSEAVSHEEACLSIDPVFLPTAAKTVREGGEPTPAYWTWLASQVEAE